MLILSMNWDTFVSIHVCSWPLWPLAYKIIVLGLNLLQQKQPIHCQIRIEKWPQHVHLVVLKECVLVSAWLNYLQIVEVGLKVSKVRQHLSAKRGEAAGLWRWRKPQVDARIGSTALWGAQLLPCGWRQDVIICAALSWATITLQD